MYLICMLWHVLVAVVFLVLCVTISTHARVLEAKIKTHTFGWVDWKFCCIKIMFYQWYCIAKMCAQNFLIAGS